MSKPKFALGTCAPLIPIEDLSLNQWNDVVSISQGGRIINNGSISARAPRPMSAPLMAAKMPFIGRG
jgi:hypothetical protein